MDKRYQVFVSSTYEDLQDERKEVMQALLELDCIPAGMELFPASNDDQWTLIKRVIDDCDYYLLIIGGKYGSTNEKGISYTQMEFEYAMETGKPIISFLHKTPNDIPVGKSEQDSEKKEKLEKFKELAKKKLIKYWDNPENLGSAVSRSMVRLIKDFPSDGWVKNNGVASEAILLEVAKLREENETLKKQLQLIATEPPKGTEGFAQGEQTVQISFTYESSDFDGSFSTYNGSLSLTWNDLFKAVAPNLIDECRESVMLNSFSELLEQGYIRERTAGGREYYQDCFKFTISQESFNLVRVQFKALGLICLTPKRKDAKFAETYWSLTPYGDFVMTQLVAMKS